MDKIPEDIIYNIIFPFLTNKSGCNLTEPQIVLVNKRVYSSKSACFSPKLCFGGQSWCSVHTPHEYNFSKYFKRQLELIISKKKLTKLITSIKPLPCSLFPFLNDDTLAYHDSNRVYTPDELLYYWNRVLEKSFYKIEHLCCAGNGVSFADRFTDENI